MRHEDFRKNVYHIASKMAQRWEVDDRAAELVTNITNLLNQMLKHDVGLDAETSSEVCDQIGIELYNELLKYKEELTNET